MMKKYIVFLLITIILSVVLGSCKQSAEIGGTKPELNNAGSTLDNENQMSDSKSLVSEKDNMVENSGFSVVTAVVDYDELYQIVQDKPTYKELDTKFPIEYSRYDYNIHRALYNTSKGWVLVNFDNDDAFYTFQTVDISEGIYENSLDQIKIGMSLDDVMAIDPDADYTFLYANWSEYPKISYHYTEEGLRYTIYYDDNYGVRMLIKEVF